MHTNTRARRRLSQRSELVFGDVQAVFEFLGGIIPPFALTYAPKTNTREDALRRHTTAETPHSVECADLNLLQNVGFGSLLCCADNPLRNQMRGNSKRVQFVPGMRFLR